MLFLKNQQNQHKASWNLNEKSLSINYDSSQFPVAEKLIKKEFIGFLCLGSPNGIKEMDIIIKSFKKIINNLDELKNFKEQDLKIRIGR